MLLIGANEWIEFSYNDGGDEYARGLECEIRLDDGREDIGYFSPEVGLIRLFTAAKAEGGDILVIVNYASMACDDLTTFVYMHDGCFGTVTVPGAFPAEFDPEAQTFYMTNGTSLTVDEITG